MLSFWKFRISLKNNNLAKLINEQAKKNDRKADVLIQVNISAEDSKFGLNIADIPDFMKKAIEYPYLSVKGFMGMAELTEREDLLRKEFHSLKQLFDQQNEILAKKDYPQMDILSMGMTNDYTIAIEEGSNMVRIGSAIFGG